MIPLVLKTWSSDTRSLQSNQPFGPLSHFLRFELRLDERLNALVGARLPLLIRREISGLRGLGWIRLGILLHE